MVAGDTSAIGAPGAIQAIDGCSPNDPSQSASHANAPAECTFLQNQAGKHQQPTEATAPSSAAIDIPLPVIKFTEPVPTRDQIQGKAVEYEIRTFGSEELTFQEWMAASSDAEVRGYFRALCTELDTVMKLEDYHLKLCNRFDHAERRTLPGWEVIVWYHVTDGAAGPPPLEGPLKVDRCMSCDMDCPLELGVAGTCGDNANPGPTAGDSLLSESALHRVWIDGKGRPLLIVTPKRHVERLGTLTNEESVDLWRTALGIMRDFKLKNFENMIINHGNNRNHAHMHLKIKPKAWEFEKVAVAAMTPDQRAKLQLIRDFSVKQLGRRPENHYYEERPSKLARA